MHVVRNPPALVSPRPRRAAMLAFVALAGACADAVAEMGGGGGRGHGKGGAADTPDKPAADCPKADAVAPADLTATFARRLRDVPPEFALTPAQMPAYQDFVASAAEVGQHNERWLQKSAAVSTGTVSAAEPVGAFIAGEVGAGDDRQQALQDLGARHAALVTMLSPSQRAALTALFVTTRSDLRAAASR